MQTWRPLVLAAAIVVMVYDGAVHPERQHVALLVVFFGLIALARHRRVSP